MNSREKVLLTDNYAPVDNYLAPSLPEDGPAIAVTTISVEPTLDRTSRTTITIAQTAAQAANR